MTLGKEWKHILLFSLPIIAGNLLQQLYNAVDGIIVGQFVSEGAFAGVSNCASLAYLFVAFAVGLSLGVGIVIAQYFGAGKHDELPVCIDTALILLGACGLFLTVVSLLFAPFLFGTVLSVPDNVIPYALTYFRIYSLGFFFQFIYNAIAAALRSLGDSNAVLIFLVVATVLNTVLDLLFVVVFRWSVAGAAAATVAAQAVCAAVSYKYMRKRFPFVKAGKHWNRKISATMARLGLPVALTQCLVAIGQGALQRLVNGFEDMYPGVIAAYGAGIRLDAFIYAPTQGLQAGLAGFTGQNIGAGKLDRIKRGLRATHLMSLLVTVAMSVLLYAFAGQIVALFGLSGGARLIGIEQVRFLSLFFWTFSLFATFSGLIQGAGDTLLMSAVSLSSLAIRIVTAYATVGVGLLHYNAAWVTFPMGWSLAIIILVTRYLTGGWKKKAVAGKFSREGS